MTLSELIIHFWHFNLVSVVIATVLVVFQILTNKNEPGHKNLLFFTGVLLMLLVTVSPLAYLGKGYLFSAHMIEHIVLLLIVPPLLLSGINPGLIEKLSRSRFRKTGDILFSVPVAWILGIGSMYVWHIPALFGAMKNSPVLHAVHIVSLLLLGIIFIWPVYSPVAWRKISPLGSALYLFIACVGCTVLGILITFAPSSVYIPFMTGSNQAVWDLVRTSWGISPAVDQQAGGLIMWVPACFIYITNIMVTLNSYYSRPETEENEY